MHKCPLYPVFSVPATGLWLCVFVCFRVLWQCRAGGGGGLSTTEVEHLDGGHCFVMFSAADGLGVLGWVVGWF